MVGSKKIINIRRPINFNHLEISMIKKWTKIPICIRNSSRTTLIDGKKKLGKK